MYKSQVIEITTGCLKLRLNGKKKIELKLKKAAGNVPLPGPIEMVIENNRTTFPEELFSEISLSNMDFEDGISLLNTSGKIESLFEEIENNVHSLSKKLYKYAQ